MGCTITFFSWFLSKLKKLYFGGTEWKILGTTNKHKWYILLTFLSFIFLPPNNHFSYTLKNMISIIIIKLWNGLFKTPFQSVNLCTVVCSNHYIITITLIKISKRSVEHQNKKILESWKKKLYGLVFFHSAMSICIILQRHGPCLVLKNISYFVFFFENEYSFSEFAFRIKNPFSFCLYLALVLNTGFEKKNIDMPVFHLVHIQGRSQEGSRGGKCPPDLLPNSFNIAAQCLFCPLLLDF